MIKKQSTVRFKGADGVDLEIQMALDYHANAIKNQVWYRGEKYELEQLYKMLSYRGMENNFWGQTASTKGQEVLKLHSGLPSKMVDCMTQIVLSDFRDISFEKGEHTELWGKIAEENDFKRFVKGIVRDVLVVGDGAAKIDYDTIFTPYPLLQFSGGDKVEYVYRNGRIIEIIFKTKYCHDNKEYTLKETRGYGYIFYKLFDNLGNEQPLDTIPETANLSDCRFAGAELDKDGKVLKYGAYMMAVPVIFYPSSKYEGRGESIFDKRVDGFASIDEDLSQWLVNVRSAMPKMFINDELLPRDLKKGSTIMKPNAFDNRFITTHSATETRDPKNDIQMVQFDILWQSYAETRAALIDDVLQGFIYPASMGIDLKRTDNAESQREKEKVSLFTRAAITDVLGEALEKLVKIAIVSYYELHGGSTEEPRPNIDFGEYANPARDAVIDTTVKAVQGNIMSTRTGIKEINRDKDDAWIDEEEARIKEEKGFVSTNDDFSLFSSFGAEYDGEEKGQEWE